MGFVVPLIPHAGKEGMEMDTVKQAEELLPGKWGALGVCAGPLLPVN